jgi:hypothetical protein
VLPRRYVCFEHEDEVWRPPQLLRAAPPDEVELTKLTGLVRPNHLKQLPDLRLPCKLHPQFLEHRSKASLIGLPSVALRRINDLNSDRHQPSRCTMSTRPDASTSRGGSTISYSWVVPLLNAADAADGLV